MRAIERRRHRLTTLPYERSLHSSQWCLTAALDLRSTPRSPPRCTLNSTLHTVRSTTTSSITVALWTSTCCSYGDYATTSTTWQYAKWLSHSSPDSAHHRDVHTNRLTTQLERGRAHLLTGLPRFKDKWISSMAMMINEITKVLQLLVSDQRLLWYRMV